MLIVKDPKTLKELSFLQWLFYSHPEDLIYDVREGRKWMRIYFEENIF